MFEQIILPALLAVVAVGVRLMIEPEGPSADRIAVAIIVALVFAALASLVLVDTKVSSGIAYAITFVVAFLADDIGRALRRAGAALKDHPLETIAKVLPWLRRPR